MKWPKVLYRKRGKDAITVKLSTTGAILIYSANGAVRVSAHNDDGMLTVTPENSGLAVIRGTMINGVQMVVGYIIRRPV